MSNGKNGAVGCLQITANEKNKLLRMLVEYQVACVYSKPVRNADAMKKLLQLVYKKQNK